MPDMRVGAGGARPVEGAGSVSAPGAASPERPRGRHGLRTVTVGTAGGAGELGVGSGSPGLSRARPRRVGVVSVGEVNRAEPAPLPAVERGRANLFIRLGGKVKGALDRFKAWFAKQFSSAAAPSSAPGSKVGVTAPGSMRRPADGGPAPADRARTYEKPRPLPAQRDLRSPLPDLPVEPGARPVGAGDRTGLLVLVRQFNRVHDGIRDSVFINVRDGRVADMDGVMENLREETVKAMEPRVERWYSELAGELPTEDVFDAVEKVIAGADVRDTDEVVREVRAEILRLVEEAEG